jgi:hypothetical protein
VRRKRQQNKGVKENIRVSVGRDGGGGNALEREQRKEGRENRKDALRTRTHLEDGSTVCFEEVSVDVGVVRESMAEVGSGEKAKR